MKYKPGDILYNFEFKEYVKITRVRFDHQARSSLGGRPLESYFFELCREPKNLLQWEWWDYVSGFRKVSALERLLFL